MILHLENKFASLTRLETHILESRDWFQDFLMVDVSVKDFSCLPSNLSPKLFSSLSYFSILSFFIFSVTFWDHRKDLRFMEFVSTITCRAQSSSVTSGFRGPFCNQPQKYQKVTILWCGFHHDPYNYLYTCFRFPDSRLCFQVRIAFFLLYLMGFYLT